MSSRWVNVSASGETIKPPFGSRASAVTTGARGLQNRRRNKLHLEFLRCLLRRKRYSRTIGAPLRIEHAGDMCGSRGDLLEKSHPLAPNANVQVRKAGHISTWVGHARYQALTAGSMIVEYDRNRVAPAPRRARVRCCCQARQMLAGLSLRAGRGIRDVPVARAMRGFMQWK
jgi:hypothetical protein